MTLPNEAPLQKLQFYVTTPYQCGYLPKQLAQSLIASPQSLVNAQIYSGLIQQGFRRSGKFAYRPHCEHCQACIPVRLILSKFKPNRSQKRAYQAYQFLKVRILPIAFHQAHFELYQTYQLLRHSDGIETEHGQSDSVSQYQQFLCQSNVDSLMIEFTDDTGAIKIVSVVDVVDDGISAVYTFYDASNPKHSYGTFAVVWLAEWAKTLHLPYLYLGYWIKDSHKMSYKQSFNPQEKLIEGEWRT
jgi:leucyl-tRNA---protein transferase